MSTRFQDELIPLPKIRNASRATNPVSPLWCLLAERYQKLVTGGVRTGSGSTEDYPLLKFGNDVAEEERRVLAISFVRSLRFSNVITTQSMWYKCLCCRNLVTGVTKAVT